MNELELRDIHLPEVSLWWPPAPGWWIALLLLPVMTVMLLWVIRRIKQKPLRRLSLRELERIRRQHSGGLNDKAVLGDIAALLRRTMISYHGRQHYAATSGEDWIKQLQQVAPKHGFSDAQLQLLARDRYKPDYACDIENLLQGCEHWIRALPRREPRVSA
jgi:Domain of unknown function (DUF4381)